MLSPKTTSIRRWAESLCEYSHTARAREAAAYWLDDFGYRGRLPRDDISAGIAEAPNETVSVRLETANTVKLLQDVPSAYRTQIPEVILTSILRPLVSWMGGEKLRIDIEGHGREEIVDGVDLLRTVGWFTSIYPLVIHLDPDDELGDALKSVKEQMRAVPNRGIDFGVVRYLDEAHQRSKSLRDLPQAQILFNYLGQWDQLLGATSQFSFERPIEISTSGFGAPIYQIEVNALVFEGVLQLNWTFNPSYHKRVTLDALANEAIVTLRELIAYCLHSRGDGMTSHQIFHPLT